MIVIRGQSEKLRSCFKSSCSFSSGASVPVLPSNSAVPILSSEIVKISSFKGTKRRSRKFSGNGGGFGPSGGPFNSFTNSTTMIEPLNNFKEPKKEKEEFVNLFSIYGNILMKEGEGELLIPFSSEKLGEEFQKYPLETNLMNLFENSVRFWYESESGKEEKKLPLILSINAPSRSSTWELTKFLVGKSGKSNLAIIPFSMFYELLQSCSKTNLNNSNSNNMKEAKALGDFILNNITSGFNPKKKISPFVVSNNSMSMSSCAVIEVVEYLFACLEASLGGKEGQQSNEDERFTLLLDGFEEFLQTKRGSEVILKDLNNWTNSIESSGRKRKLIFGGRNQNLNEEIGLEVEQEEQGENGEDPNGSSIINISSSNSINSSSNSNNNSNSNKATSPFQVITDFFIKAAETKSEKSSHENVSITNVKIEGTILKLFVNGPKSDKRQLLKYSQKIGIDRKKDIFDRNILNLKSVAINRWNMKLKLNLKSKYDFPSNHQEIWEKLSETGKGILVKRKLSRDEINEIILYVLGETSNKIKGVAGLESLCEGIENVSQIRFDPTKFSSDDLSHLLAERQISMNSLTKYEKRFINCISTATTQTRFDDISLPEKTVTTLRSLTTLPLTHPELFTQGVLKNSLTGVLLFGPPGTGKTMLARAVAQESGAVFLAVNMSNIFDMWVGEGEKNVKVIQKYFV